MIRIQLTTFCLITLIATSVFACGSEWGHLRGQFIYDGPAPKPKVIPVMKDTAVFGEATTDESLLVHPENMGLANVVIYFVPKTGEKLLVHISYLRTASAKVELTMKGGQFKPRILLLQTTQTMVQRNKDKAGHHAHIQFVNNPPK
jgi:hypothetical protein